MIRCLPEEVKNLNDSIDFEFGQLKVSIPMKNFFGQDFSHFERNKNILRDLNLPQNFAWSDSAPDIHKNKETDTITS